jgi:ankyrin repeat protein
MNEQLVEAIQAGDAARVNSLLDAHPELVNAHAPNGVSAVSLAMYHGKVEIARTLIGRGATLDLFTACAAGIVERVRQLVPPESADAISPDGFPALGLACFFGHEEIARYLLDRGADPNLAATNSLRVRPVHAATARRSEAIVRMLLESGADPNSKQQNGFTALHAAAGHGDAGVIDLLLKHGADPTIPNDEGRMPSDLAGNPQIAARLRR